ncbi:MAG TPA: tRNA (adenosine(37)-N6)-threonylcarbamoyltransferase complex dimerization subunit type 1 TsaB [Terracidiphilus sp.]|jgi:tRNA threonylcarbamoyladenosine biosynthesis protein TsaB
MSDETLVLGMDTCGTSGSVALARLSGNGVQVLGEATLEGRSYAATLVAAISDLLETHTLTLREVGCLVVTSGPGSFTGVRVGLSAAKGLAEGAGLPIIAVSRLAVLGQKAGVADAALDAHRHEVFLRAGGRELLAGREELAALEPAPRQIALCDEAAAALLAECCPGAELVRVAPPTAAEAIAVTAQRIEAREFDSVLLLDGHYLRRSDAEIFGEPAASASQRGDGS